MGALPTGWPCMAGSVPSAATFLIFSDYMRPSIRLAALMKAPAVFVLTHDSIGLGEDGPTHQPVEHLASLRAMPGLASSAPRTQTRRPPRGRSRSSGPGPVGARAVAPEPADRGRPRPRSSGVARGAYVLAEAAGGAPDGILHRDRLGSVARAGGPGAAGVRGHTRPCREHAILGAFRRPDKASTVERRCCPLRAGSRHGGGGRDLRLGEPRWRSRRVGGARPLRRVGAGGARIPGVGFTSEPWSRRRGVVRAKEA